MPDAPETFPLPVPEHLTVAEFIPALSNTLRFHNRMEVNRSTHLTPSASPLSATTPAQLREAERGFKLVLRRKFSAAWIAKHSRDLLGQANVEYAEWLEDNAPARNPVGWLITCAYRRAQNLLDSQTRRPPQVSLEAVFQLPDETTPTPEEKALEGDRTARLRKALGHLPERECKLLALVYFNDHSVREAGRKLGWQKSAADRHHRSALDKLRALVGDDRSLFSPAHLGWMAWALAYSERGQLGRAFEAMLRPPREALVLGVEAGDWVARHLSALARRLTLPGEQASAMASSGGGRFVGACGVAVASVICGIAGGGGSPAGGAAAVGQAIPVIGPVGSTLATQVASIAPVAPGLTPTVAASPQTPADAPRYRPAFGSGQPAIEPPGAEAEPSDPQLGPGGESAGSGGISVTPNPEPTQPPLPPPAEAEAPPPVPNPGLGSP